MCHPEFMPGSVPPLVATEEIMLGALPVLHAMPETDARGCVVVAADITGRSPFYEQIAGRLAQAGFHALLPDLFYRQGPPAEPTREAIHARRAALDDDAAIDDLERCVTHGRSLDGVRSRVGTVGFCMGGTFVLNVCSRRDDVATVCYYGFPAGSPNRAGSPAPIDVSDAMVGPILGFWGDRDELVGMDNVARLAAALSERGVAFDHTVYPGLPHGFLAALTDETHEWHPGACDSWTRAIDFFRSNA